MLGINTCNLEIIEHGKVSSDDDAVHIATGFCKLDCGALGVASSVSPTRFHGNHLANRISKQNKSCIFSDIYLLYSLLTIELLFLFIYV